MVRDEDVSGCSGIGVVAELFESSLGPVHLFWLREPYGETRYASITDLLNIHGHGGRTYLVKVCEVTGEMRNLALEQPSREELAA